jgi:hypothetical protein
MPLMADWLIDTIKIDYLIPMDTEEVLNTEQTESIDSSNDDVELELVDESQAQVAEVTPEEPDYKALLEAEKARNAKLYARLKKSTQTMPTKAPETNSLTREEAILIAKGYSEEELKVLNRIKKGAEAEGTKMSFLEATEDEVFKAWKSKLDAQARSKKAQLGASGGSSVKPVELAKMTEEEHREYFEKKVKEALN